MPYAYISGRVSHRSSGLSGLSEVNQYETCKRYIANVLPDVPIGQACYPAGNPQGYFFDRAHTAWKIAFTQRPAAFALTRVLKPGDHVVAYSLERCFRSVKAFCHQMDNWVANDITFHSATEIINFHTAEGKMIARVLAVFGEYYSDLISERIREALAIKRLGHSYTPRQDETNWAGSNFRFAPTATKEPVRTPGRIFCYERCSDIDSTISGLGLHVQTNGTRAYAKRLMGTRPELTLSDEAFRDESVSAFSVPFAERPQGKRLMAMLQPGDIVVVYRLDRIFRTPQDAAKISEELRKRNIGIHIVQSGLDTLSAYGQMFLTVLSVFAYLESSIKSKRAKEVCEKLKQEGRPYAPIPRHAKVIRDANVRKLAYDFDEISKMAAVYLCHDALGLTTMKTSDVLHSIQCAQTGETPKMHGVRKRWSRRCIQTAHDKFLELTSILPPEAIQECLENATKLLTTPIEKPYNKFLTFEFPVPQTAERIRDHLDSAGICEPLPLL